MVARASREFGKAQRLEFAPDRRLVDLDAEFLEYPAHQILASPPDDAVDRRDRSPFDHVYQRLTLLLVQLRPIARRLAVDQSIQTAGIEPHHPVADDLQGDAADPCRIAARAAVVDLGQCQKAPGLGGVLRPLCRSSQQRPIEIWPKRDRYRHGKPPFAINDSDFPSVGNPQRVSLHARWYETLNFLQIWVESVDHGDGRCDHHGSQRNRSLEC